jgi:hypothetical protein
MPVSAVPPTLVSVGPATMGSADRSIRGSVVLPTQALEARGMMALGGLRIQGLEGRATQV